MRFVGIDPGRTGAAVVLGDDGVTVLDWRAWRRRATPPDLGELMADATLIAVEAQYLGENARSLVGLVEWTGRLLATIPPGTPVLRPLASVWRAKVLRRSSLRRDAAKQLAIRAAAPHLPPELGESPDASEAWCIARYCWGAHRAGLVA